MATLGAVYSRAGSTVVHPLLEPRFVAALARSYGPLGPLSRSRVVGDLAGHLLPQVVTFRRTKSDFTRALVTPGVRRLVAAWDGSTGVDRSLVDPDRLRAEWCSPRPSALSLQLLLEVVAAMRGAGARP
jgi:asparagine synthase (glutamine-hydrolysing)